VALFIVAVIAADPAVAVLALSPSSLAGAAIARWIGAREETVAALMTGTIVLSFALLPAAVPALAVTMNMGLAALVVGVVVAGSFPQIRDGILPVLDPARYAALAAILTVTAITSISLVDGRSIALAGILLVAGALSAAIGAWVFGGDPLPAAIGGGTRDFGVAAAVAMLVGLAGGGAMPLAYAGLLGLATALGKFVVRRQT